MQLTQQQLDFFDAFGFLVFRQLLEPAEMKRYLEEFEVGLDSWHNAGRHDGENRHWAPFLDERTPFITSLIDDPRFAGVAEQLLREPVLGVECDGNYYVGDTRWHPDTSSLDWEGVKFAIYGEPLDGSSGALRVVPGSHCEPLHSQIRAVVNAPHEADGLHEARPDEIPAYVFRSDPGDALVFNVGVWHASFGGGGQRRMGTVTYFEDPKAPKATALIQDVIMMHHRNFSTRYGYSGQRFSEYWRSVEDSRHQRWVRRLAEMGVLDTPAAG